MHDFEQLQSQLLQTKLAPLLPFLAPDFVTGLNHGKLQQWLQAVETAPAIIPSQVSLGSKISVGTRDDASAEDRRALDKLLKEFIPWRKGPFELFEIDIDTEWQSSQKWARLIDHIEPLKDRRILDVGSGNGYFCLRMIEAGAAMALGIDPHLPYVMQFWLIKKYLADVPAYVLPLTLDQLPLPLPYFDTVFSMGVIYHRRSPFDHLLELKNCIRAGGQLVMESIVVPGPEGYSLSPEGRYARMSNVWFVPTSATLMSWLSKCGFTNVKLVDESKTTLAEQRKTAWMPFNSLNDALSNDGETTIEGYPAPARAVITASKP
jgi:tRNA (mo5U34)-methyltransferase